MPKTQSLPQPGTAATRNSGFPPGGADHPAIPSSELDVASNLEIINILLLDDDTELADTLKNLLLAHNFLVTVVGNGVAGLQEIMDMDFDVILCDLLMPTMPGDMFYLAVQKVKPHLCKRFLFITGHGDDPRTSEFLRTTDGLAVFKPVPADELIQMISLVLRRNAQKAA